MVFTRQTHCKNGHELTPENVYVKRRIDGRTYRQCKICHKAWHRARYAALTPEQRAKRRKSFPSNTKMREYQRKHRFATKYGITVGAAKSLLIEQDGLCAICYDAPATNLDHDHATGRVRGWLCWACNTGLGKFGDDTERLRNAVAYLEEVVA